MQSVWQLNGDRKLLLFFSGWGMNERLTEHLHGGLYDICTCFDYRELETNEAERWRAYSEIVLVAWSMGVWAAEQVLADHELPIVQAIAINGTPSPVDDRWGIPRSVAQATLDGLTPDSLHRFYRRMVGGGAGLKAMEQAGRLPAINLDERKAELAAILARAPYPEGRLRWSEAVIGLRDAIFPPEILRTYWQGRATIREIDAPHDPFEQVATWEELIGEQ
jgi:biotin synthesis protein BioG